MESVVSLKEPKQEKKVRFVLYKDDFLLNEDSRSIWEENNNNNNPPV